MWEFIKGLFVNNPKLSSTISAALAQLLFSLFGMPEEATLPFIGVFLAYIFGVSQGKKTEAAKAESSEPKS